MREIMLRMETGQVVDMSEYRYNSLRTIVARLNKKELGEWSVTSSAKNGRVYVIRIV